LKNVGMVDTVGTIKFVDLCAGLGGFHRGLTTAAATAAQKHGVNVAFECVTAAEIEDDLRRSYVANFPEIAQTYRRLFGKGCSKVAEWPSLDHPLVSSMPSFDGEGKLVRVHGDMTWFLDDEQTALRKDLQGNTVLPAHDLLCAGFPCQPFSKSGAQLGFEDTRGTVFHIIATILREHRPAFIFLENVGNFPKHDGGNTWARVKKILEEELGYALIATDHVGAGEAGGLLSPHHLGHPHHRERFFIVGQRKATRPGDSALVRSLLREKFEHSAVFPSVRKNGTLSTSANRVLDEKAKGELISIIAKEKSPEEKGGLIASQISPDRVRCINHWGELLRQLKKLDDKNKCTTWRDSMPSFPIWGYELDPWHWYPVDINPGHYTFDPSYLSDRRRGLFASARTAVQNATEQRIDIKLFPPGGDRDWLAKNFTASRINDWIESWPGYAGKREEWPRWKQRFIEQNREWAIKLWSNLDPKWLRGWLDKLYEEIKIPSFQKLEWNCKGENLDIWEHILQFRPSGLRVKRLAHVPALVAMTTTQIPIVPRQNPLEATTGSTVGARGRHLVPSEALQLQGFPGNWRLPMTRERAFTCFGNAVHVGVVHDVVLNWMFNRMRPGFAIPPQIESPRFSAEKLLTAPL